MLDVAMRQAALGAAIRRARKEKRWKQKELAAAVHVEPITVSRWERGVSKPDLDMLEEVGRATGKPLSFFVADEQETADEQDQLRQIVQEELEAVLEAIARLEKLVRRSSSPAPRARA